MKKVFYPGSFDPITLGHMDIIEQASKIFDQVIIAILVNPKKDSGMFSISERKEIIQRIYQNNPNIKVIAMNFGVTAVDVALENGCEFIIRGIRNLRDYDSEKEIAEFNLKLSKGRLKTIALFADQDKSIISSSAVKELFLLKKDISEYVTPIVNELMKNKQK